MKKYWFLSIIILLGVILILFTGYKKQVLDGDELYTYTLSTSKKGGFMVNNIRYNEWMDSEEVKDIFELNNNEVFSLMTIYKNQAHDVHPPFYYLVFHIFSIPFLNNFSKYPGLIVNIVAYIVLSIYLYKVSSYFIEGKEKYIPLILYTLSLGMLGTAMFIRMYMLLTMFCMAYTYYFIRLVDNINKKDLILIALTTYAGFMTHYFFLIYAFFASLIYVIYLIYKKRFKDMFRYARVMLIPVLVGFITFPFAYSHIFRGYRGTETQANLIKSSIIDNFKNIYESLNFEAFYNIMPIILIGLLIIYIIKHSKVTTQMKMIILSTLLYFLITIKIIPIDSTRYVYSMYPIISLALYYIVSRLDNRYIKYLIVVLLISQLAILQFKYEPLWTVSTVVKGNEKENIIYIVKDDYTLIHDSQFLIKYNDIYYTDDNFNDYKMINEKDNIVIKTDNIDLLERIIKHTKYTKYEVDGIGYKLK